MGVDDTGIVADAMRQYAAITDVLREDVQLCQERLHQSKSQVDARHFVRSVVTMIDGFCFAQKQLSLIALTSSAPLSPGEKLMIAEKAFEVDDKGIVRSRPVNIQLTRNVRFAFQLYARRMGIEFEPDYSNAGWSELRRTLVVRNRLTHPKCAADLEVSNQEISSAHAALAWYLRQNAEALLLAAARAEQKADAVGRLRLIPPSGTA